MMLLMLRNGKHGGRGKIKPGSIGDVRRCTPSRCMGRRSGDYGATSNAARLLARRTSRGWSQALLKSAGSQEP